MRKKEINPCGAFPVLLETLEKQKRTQGKTTMAVTGFQGSGQIVRATGYPETGSQYEKLQAQTLFSRTDLWLCLIESGMSVTQGVIDNLTETGKALQ